MASDSDLTGSVDTSPQSGIESSYICDAWRNSSFSTESSYICEAWRNSSRKPEEEICEACTEAMRKLKNKLKKYA
jgi:hypothetical protein